MIAIAALYQIVLIGKLDGRAAKVVDLVTHRVDELGLDPNVVRLIGETESDSLDPRLPTVGVFFGYSGVDQNTHPVLFKLLDASNVIITIVSDVCNVSDEIPESLRHINAIAALLPDLNFERIASLILESFRLLRRERRLFISYKRKDSQLVANQLYDALDAHGFDVFIDTRTVPPAVDFQAELWHRLSDSDVVILIDTPGFRSSRWTTEELARANSTNIQILHLLWPGQAEDPASALSHFHSLEVGDFLTTAPDARLDHLAAAAIDRICQHAERLRARAIAARYRYLVDGFCDAARDKGLAPSVQPERWISIELASGKQIAAVPAIGVPTSNRLNAIFDSVSDVTGGDSHKWVLYDSRGMLDSWLKHLSWLDGYLPLRSVSMSRANQALKEIAI